MTCHYRLCFLCLYIALAVIAIPSNASAEKILATCGPSVGHSYFFKAGVVSSRDSGYRKDEIGSGRIVAYINNSRQIDLIIKDSTGIQSYLKEGYKVDLLNSLDADKSLLISARGPYFSESYVFRLDNYGIGTVSWTASKLTEAITKTSIMTAECGSKYGLDP